MPLVQIEGVGGYLTLAQKQEMIRRVTDAVLAVEGEGLREVTWVTIEDVPSGAWGVGGVPVTADDLRALAAVPIVTPTSSVTVVGEIRP
ncbi:MAG: tautomerase family protein [Gemmatimonadetes bacterium]|nr:tautomerase family protein [Gemmatimonadota bacterium]MCC7134101.1 tautomerase family protein [Gemmatimonadales bacterium]